MTWPVPLPWQADESPGPPQSADTIAMRTLVERLRWIAQAEGGRTFNGWPERWWDVFLRRCVNNHVSSMTLRTEEGDRCLACGGHVTMTFPEDWDGPLIPPPIGRPR